MENKTNKTVSKDDLIKLVQRAAKGDNGAFENLYNLKIRSILYSSYCILHNRDDAQDASQEIFMAMCRKIADLKEPKYFNTWLHSITTKVCNNMIRRRMNRKEILDDEHFVDIHDNDLDVIPEEYLKKGELRNVLLQSLHKLSHDRRRILFMYYFDEMSYAEIAESMGMTVSVVASNISRAKKDLKKEIDSTKYLVSDKTKSVSLASALPGLLHEDGKKLFSDKVVEGLHVKFIESMAKIPAKSILTSGIKTFVKIFAGVTAGTVIATSLILSSVTGDEPAKSIGDDNSTEIVSAQPKNQEESTSTALENGSIPQMLTDEVAVDDQGKIVKKETSSSSPVFVEIVQFEGKDCDCGHVNPERSILQFIDVEEKDIRWEIQPENDDTPVYESTGSVIEAELDELYENKLDGVYTVNYYFEDNEGKTVHLRRAFHIYTEEIYPNQFE